MTRHTEEALQWGEDVAERGLREVVADRDRPWGLCSKSISEQARPVA
jgi:hypothetical protein